MSEKELTTYSAMELNKLVRAKKVKAVEIVDAFVGRIAATNGILNAFITVAAEAAMEQARAVDRQVEKGDSLSAVAGVPIAVKDNITTKGLPTTCAAKILANYVPPFNATAITRLCDKGAIIIGKTNLDQFGMGSSTENSYFGPTKNPWNLGKVAGGTSGGSAAAVAARLSPWALGSDTGGSSRQPASFCNVFGLKPTYGRVSRFGLLAYASSLDQISVIGRSALDCAALLETIAGWDPLDSTSSRREVPPYSYDLSRGTLKGGLRVGVPREFLAEGLNDDIRLVFEHSLQSLTAMRFRVIDISLPSLRYAAAAYYIIATAEASSNLSRYDGVKFGYSEAGEYPYQCLVKKTRRSGFGAETKRRILLGTFALRAGYYDRYYAKAQKVRSLVRAQLKEAFRKCDVIASPSFPQPPFDIGAFQDDPLALYLADIYTIPANLAGLPALSVPAGFTSEGLPVGLHLQADHFREDLLLEVSDRLEKETRLSLRSPAFI